MRELFSQGNLSQLVALSLFPWCLWALLKAARLPSLRWAGIAGMFMAALLFAHHPSAFLAFPLLFAVGLAALLLKPAGRRQAGLSLVAAFGLALALSAPFWLPFLVESGYGSLQRMQTGFNAAYSLVPVDQLFSPSLPLDSSSINSPRPLTIGLAQVVLAAMGALAAVVILVRARHGDAQRGAALRSAILRRTRDEDAQSGAALLLLIAVLLLICILLVLPLAAPLWTNLPLAKLIAFPWRLLGPAGLLAAVLGGAPLLLLRERPAFAGMLAVLVIAPLSVAPYLFPSPSLWGPAPAGGLTLADIGRYEVKDGSRGTASANEYLPRWVENPDPPLDLLAAYAAGQLPERLDAASLPAGARFETLTTGELESVHRIALLQASPVTLLRFYYPGWRAFVDGRPAEIRPVAPHGLIQVDMPAGEHELRVAWGQTPPRATGFALFGLGLVSAALLLIFGGPRGRQEEPRAAEAIEATDDGRSGSRWLWLAAAGFIVILAGVKAMWVEPSTSWFRLASPPDTPAGMATPLRLRYANGVELLGYTLDEPAARQGGELRLRLFWRADKPLSEDVRSFAHLDAPMTGVTWANQTKDHPGEIPSRKWPAGFYLVDDFRIAIPTGAPPVSLDLNVGLLTRAGKLIPLPDGRERIALGQVAVREARRLFGRFPQPQGVYRLGGDISLEGYDAAATSHDGAATVDLRLFWRASQKLQTDYTVFAQVFDANGQMVGQWDGPACAGSCPSSRWTPEGVIEDVRRIPLIEDAPVQGLKVLAGLYDPATGERLPVIDASGRNMPDRAIPIEVASPQNGDATR